MNKAKKKPNAAAMLESVNATTARDVIQQAAQESKEAENDKSTKSPANRQPIKKAEKKQAGRPKSDRVCKLNITLTEEDKDYLRQLSYERTSGRLIVTISDIIAEYIEADRKKKQRAKK